MDKIEKIEAVTDEKNTGFEMEATIQILIDDVILSEAGIIYVLKYPLRLSRKTKIELTTIESVTDLIALKIDTGEEQLILPFSKKIMEHMRKYHNKDFLIQILAPETAESTSVAQIKFYSEIGHQKMSPKELGMLEMAFEMVQNNMAFTH